MFTFLSPIFLVGLLSAAIPLLIHLSRSRRTKKIQFSTTRFLTDERGQYVGHMLGRKFHDQPNTVLRALYEDGLLARLESVASTVVERLAAAGYVGPAGIDALVYRDDDPKGYDLGLASMVGSRPTEPLLTRRSTS